MKKKRMLPSDYLKKGWCQRGMARNADGLIVEARAESAVQWCMVGAIRAGRLGRKHGRLFEALFEMVLKRYISSVFDYNDSPRRRKSEVVSLMRCAEKKAGLR